MADDGIVPRHSRSIRRAATEKFPRPSRTVDSDGDDDDGPGFLRPTVSTTVRDSQVRTPWKRLDSTLEDGVVEQSDDVPAQAEKVSKFRKGSLLQAVLAPLQGPQGMTKGSAHNEPMSPTSPTSRHQIQVEQLNAMKASLSQVPLFKQCSAKFVMALAEQVNHRLIEPGVDIMVEGEYGDSMYILSRGEVEIIVGGTCVCILKNGSVFGEMAAICKNPAVARRTATVRAKTLCDCRVTYRDDLLKLLTRFKDDAAVIEAEVERRLDDLREKGKLPAKKEWWRMDNSGDSSADPGKTWHSNPTPKRSSIAIGMMGELGKRRSMTMPVGRAASISLWGESAGGLKATVHKAIASLKTAKRRQSMVDERAAAASGLDRQSSQQSATTLSRSSSSSSFSRISMDTLQEEPEPTESATLSEDVAEATNSGAVAGPVTSTRGRSVSKESIASARSSKSDRGSNKSGGGRESFSACRGRLAPTAEGFDLAWQAEAGVLKPPGQKETVAGPSPEKDDLAQSPTSVDAERPRSSGTDASLMLAPSLAITPRLQTPRTPQSARARPSSTPHSAVASQMSARRRPVLLDKHPLSQGGVVGGAAVGATKQSIAYAQAAALRVASAASDRVRRDSGQAIPAASSVHLSRPTVCSRSRNPPVGHSLHTPKAPKAFMQTAFMLDEPATLWQQFQLSRERAVHAHR